jgi:hypothetical protein
LARFGRGFPVPRRVWFFAVPAGAQEANAGTAVATGVAENLQAAIAASAVEATATAQGQNTQIQISTATDAANVIGSAEAPSAAVSVSAETATATAAAQNATVTAVGVDVILRTSAANHSGASNTTPATITVPGDAVVGDFAVIFLGVKATVTLTSEPASWTAQLGTAAAGIGGTNVRSWVYTKFIEAGDIGAAVDFGLSAAQGWNTEIVVLGNVNATTPIGTAIAAGSYSPSSASVGAPAITTLANGSFVLNVWWNRFSAGPAPIPSLPATHTNIQTAAQTATGAAISSRVALVTNSATADTYGPYLASWTGTGSVMAASVGLQPAAVTGAANAVAALGDGAAETPSVEIDAAAEGISVTASAENATVQTANFINADAQTATAAVTGENTSAIVQTSAETATVTALGQDITALVASNIETATGVATGENVAANIAVNSVAAAATAIAENATVSTSGATNVNAATATATAVAQNATISEVSHLDAPDAILASTNLTGNLEDLWDDPTSPDAVFLTATNPAQATDLRVSFPTPTTPPGSGGPTLFQIYVRRTDSPGANDPTVIVDLWESGSFVTQLTSAVVTSTTGQLIQAPMNPASLSDATGSGVELRIRGVLA